MNTTTTKIAGEAMQITDEQIDKLIREYRLDGTDSVAMFNFARALLASTAAAEDWARLAKIGVRQNAGSGISPPTAPAQSCGDCHDGECYVDGSENCILRVAAQSCGDAYAGAREDLAIWKKRALEAEALNRKFMDEINGLTHMGEPHLSCGDAEQADEAVARDAERYRWMRDFNVRCKDGVDVKPPCEHVFASIYSHAVGTIPATRLVTGDELDRAIDAARAKDSK